MNDDQLWAAYAQIQKISRFAPTSPWGFALDEALAFIIDRVSSGTPCTEQQIANVIVNRTAKYRRRAAIDTDFATLPPINDAAIELRDEIARRLTRCSPRELAVIIAISQGASIAEIAVARGVPEGTIKTWAHRARLKAAA